MEDTLLHIVKQLVDHPDDVTINTLHDDNRTILEITAHKDDYGKIIGKNGRIIRAVRDLMKILAVKSNMYIDITIKESVQTEETTA
jgi:hypothetical protein